jgi:branched-chain amino acid transport system substrate-binding protein
MINAMMLALEDHGAQSGTIPIEYFAWDDASGALGKWDPAVETSNANKAVADSTILVYLDTYNSGAAKLSIPILNQGGPLVMIGSGNTYPGLTKQSGAEFGEPEKYYPTGIRNYTRVVAADDVQGVMGARWYKKLDLTSVFILDDHQLYGKGVADVFEAEARAVGLEVIEHGRFDTKATDYSALVKKIVKSGADSVYFGGLASDHPGLVLRALHAAGWQGQFGGPDGIFASSFIQEAGRDAEGTIATAVGLPPQVLSEQSPAGQAWYNKYKERYQSEPEFYAPYAYESMRVALAAIDQCVSSGTVTRACVRDEVFSTRDFQGILGMPWSFDADGDTTLNLTSGNKVLNGRWQFVEVLK